MRQGFQRRVQHYIEPTQTFMQPIDSSKIRITVFDVSICPSLPLETSTYQYPIDTCSSRKISCHAEQTCFGLHLLRKDTAPTSQDPFISNWSYTSVVTLAKLG